MAELGGKAGGLAEAGKLTPISYAQQLAAGDRTLAGLKVPFGPQILNTNLGISPAFAAKLAEKIGYSAPLRLLRGLFSASAAGDKMVFGREEQILRDLAFSKQSSLLAGVDNFNAIYGKTEVELQKMYGEIAEHAGAQNNAAAFTDWSQRIRRRRDRSRRSRSKTSSPAWPMARFPIRRP